MRTSKNALGVAPIPTNMMSAGTNAFLRGCNTLGLKAGALRHNRDTCIGCGFCNYGCRYDRKTSMLVTFIPWAEARGAFVYGPGRTRKRSIERGDSIAHVNFERFGRSEATHTGCGGRYLWRDRLFGTAEKMEAFTNPILASDPVSQQKFRRADRATSNDHRIRCESLTSSETLEVDVGDGVAALDERYVFDLVVDECSTSFRPWNEGHEH